jgi:thiol-disulfide isomerase/thioredoxin
MKKQREKNLITILMGWPFIRKSLQIEQLRRNQRSLRSSRMLAITFTLFLQFPGISGKSQSILECSVPGTDQTVEIFTFTRINTISGIHTIDTLVMKEAGKYSLQVYNITLPGIGVIRKGNEDLREVFLAPGFPLQILINKRQTVKTESVTGAWQSIDSAFRRISTEYLVPYNYAYASSEAPERIKLFDHLLKSIDSVIEAPHRSLKDFIFYRLMRESVDSSDQIFSLNNQKMLYLSYLNQLAYGSFRNDIDRRYNYKLNMLISAQYGKPAPLFKLRDTTGKIYSLDEFKGKLVYIDLWASWCLPCRLETPYMHNIISRYSNRPDIVFIGIAVADKMPAWKRAIRQDKPRWLQLHDNNTFVINAYSATAVPRYILIDKAGNVLDFNAPPPSQHAKLVAIIDKELRN